MDQPDPPPAKIGRYDIVRRLGVGGMAEVFEARSPGAAGFSKTVVVKRMLPHLSHQPYYANMFVREAKIAASVNHRTVVQVFELDQLESGEYFMVMEFVRGPDLRQMLARAAQVKRRLPPWFSVYCVAEVLDGLDYAYNALDDKGQPRKMIHRDVTPSNIFVSMLGEVKLGDFGVARDDTFASETRAGQHKGKVAYMAPEQLLNQGVDGRVDVFSAGVVLWECLTQSRLFGGKPDLEAMNLIVNAPRRPPSSIKPDVAKEIDEIVIAALEPDPDRRIPSAKAFRARLLEALHKRHGSVLSEDVRAVVEVLQGKRPADEVLEPSGSAPTGSQAFVGDKSSSADSQDLRDLRTTTSAPPAPTTDLNSSSGSRTPPPSQQLADDLELPPRPPPPARTPTPTQLSAMTPPAMPSAMTPPVMVGAPIVGAPIVGTAIPPTASGTFRLVTGLPAGSPTKSSSSYEIIRPPPTSRSSSHLTPTPVPAPVMVPPVIAPAPPPMPSPPSFKDPRGMDDMDALIKAAVASVAPEDKTEKLLPQSSNIAGLDVRRHANTLSDKAMQRWSSFGIDQLYEGPYPHYLRDREGTVIGPVTLDQAHAIFKMEGFARLAGEGSISGDAERWVTLTRYAEITGQTMYVRDDAENRPAPTNAYGNLKDRSIPSLFSGFWRMKAWGRLIVINEGYRKFEMRELEIADGRPCTAYANSEALQLPALLRSKKLVPDGLLVELMWKTILVDRPLLEVASAQLARNLDSYRGGIDKERWVDVANWDVGAIFFDPYFKTNARPLAPSVLNLLPPMIGKGMDMVKLKAKLGTRADGLLKPTASFEDDLVNLGLPEQQLEVIAQVAKGKRVSQIIKVYAGIDKMLLPLIYILLEIGALAVA